MMAPAHNSPINIARYNTVCVDGMASTKNRSAGHVLRSGEIFTGPHNLGLVAAWRSVHSNMW